MNLQTFSFLLLALIVLVGLFRPKRVVRTERIGIVFHKENNLTMAAPTSTGTTNNGNPIFATVQPLQASGANSNGTVSNIAVTLSDTGVVTATVKTSASNVPYIEFDTVAIGTAVATVTCTVTDPDGTVTNFTTTANVVVIAGAGDILTASVEILFSSTQPA